MKEEASGRLADQSVTSNGASHQSVQEHVQNVPEPVEPPPEWREPETTKERMSLSPRGGLAPLVLEADGTMQDGDAFQGSPMGGLEIPPPLSESRQVSADMISAKRDSTKSSARRSSASSSASLSKPNKNAAPLLDGLSVATSESDSRTNAVEDLRTPAFGAQLSGGTESSSTDGEDKSDDDSGSSGGDKPAPMAVPATVIKPLGGSDSGEGSDSGSTSSSSSESGSEDEDASKQSSQDEARKGRASTNSDWI
jgi:hypothetical protein